jgi:hypothetical protein
VDKRVIKVGYLVSYDWHLLRHSIPQIYDDADLIVLALDVNRKSWAGQNFKFDESLFCEFIKIIDVQRKITVYEDEFYQPALTTMQCEVRERKMLAERMGSGGWHIQLDCDEYPLNFNQFVATLKSIDPNPDPLKIRRPVNVTGNLISVIKAVANGFIIVKPQRDNQELCMLATQIPDYWSGRRNGHFNIHTSLMIIHETRSRTEEEFYFKLKNWGHNQDFNTDSYFELWKAIDRYNYKFVKNFNPTGMGIWPELSFVEAKDIEALISHFKADKSILPSRWSLFLTNSRTIGRLRAFFRKLL